MSELTNEISTVGRGAQAHQASETKCRIVAAARQLFSSFGFSGTSVREIAKHSQVNLAAVNYHFKNKENLLWEVLAEGYSDCENLTREIALRSSSLEELALGLFDHFVEHKDMIRNNMKLLMSDGLKPPADSAFMKRSRQSLGPPGSQYIAEMIQKEVQYPLNARGVFWGVKSLFGPIIHWATICTCSHIEEQSLENPNLRPAEMRKDVALVARSTLFYLNAHPDIFRE